MTPRRPPATARRRIVFRLLAVLLSLLPLLLIEVGLRLWWPHEQTPQEAVDRDPLVDLHHLRPLFEPSPDGATMAIPTARSNFFQPASFPVEKPAKGRRVFVIGGSTVQGRPYATETAFPKLLELQLQVSSPNLQWQVVNCGGVSYASYRVAAIVDEVLKYQPDLLIVYTGHNEFLEARTYARYRHVPRWLAPAMATGGRLRVVQELAAIGRPDVPERTRLSPEVDARLDHSGGLAGYQRDDAFRQAVEQHFASTLRRIVNAAAQADVPLLLCVPASNTIEVPPFKTAMVDDATPAMRASWRRAIDAELPWPERRRGCEDLLAADPHHAGAAYLLGRQLWETEHYKAAADWLRVARDCDVCPLRATSVIEQTVRTIATENQVPMLDVAQLFADPRHPELASPTRFVDHVHPAVYGGHTAIADALHDQIAATWPELLETVDAPPGPSTTALLSPRAARQAAMLQYLGTIDEAYFQRGKQRLAGLERWAAGRAAEPLPAAEP